MVSGFESNRFESIPTSETTPDEAQPFPVKYLTLQLKPQAMAFDT
jgi:hypothetical protein